MTDSKNRNPKIFQIGFNRCATRSIGEWFELNNIPSAHCWLNIDLEQQRDLSKLYAIHTHTPQIGCYMYQIEFT